MKNVVSREFQEHDSSVRLCDAARVAHVRRLGSCICGALSLSVGLLSVMGAAAAETWIWTGAGGDGSWINPHNWGRVTAGDYPRRYSDTVVFPNGCEVVLDTGCMISNGCMKVSAGKVKITATAGSRIQMGNLTEIGAGGFVVGGDSATSSAAELEMDVPYTEWPGLRLDKWYGGSFVYSGSLVNGSCGDAYGFIFGAGSNVLAHAASMDLRVSVLGVGNGSPTDQPARLVIRDQANVRVAGIHVNARGAAGAAGAEIVQTGEETCVTVKNANGVLGDLWVGQGGAPTVENNYVLESGTLRAGRLLVGATGLKSGYTSKGLFEMRGGAATFDGLRLAGPNDRLVISGGKFCAEDTMFIPATAEISGTPSFSVVAGKRLNFCAYPDAEKVVIDSIGGVQIASNFVATCPLEIKGGYFTVLSGVRGETSADHATWPISVATGLSFVMESRTSYCTMPVDLTIAQGGNLAIRNGAALVAHRLTYNGTEWPKGIFQGGGSGAPGCLENQSNRGYLLIPHVWTGAGDGSSWSDAGNWDSQTVPPNASTTAVDLSSATNAVILTEDVSVGTIVMHAHERRMLTLTGTGKLTLRPFATSMPVLMIAEGRTLALDVDLVFPNQYQGDILGGGTLRILKNYPQYGCFSASGSWDVPYTSSVNVEFAGRTSFSAWGGQTSHNLVFRPLDGDRAYKVSFLEGCEVSVAGDMVYNSINVPMGEYLQSGGSVNVAGRVFIQATTQTKAGDEAMTTYDVPMCYRIQDGSLSVQDASGILLGTRYSGSWTYSYGGRLIVEGGMVTTPCLQCECYSNYVELAGGTLRVGSGGLKLVSTHRDDEAGTLEKQRLAKYRDPYALRFRGGTLEARGDLTCELGMVFDEASEGSTNRIDTGAYTVTVVNGTRGAGRLTKTGTGVLRLAGPNALGDCVRVEDGRIEITGTVTHDPTSLDLKSSASLVLPSNVHLEVEDVLIGGRPRVHDVTLTFGSGTVHVNGGVPQQGTLFLFR